MATLEKAIRLACKAHKWQVDKGGQPYILHPLRVMMAMPDDENLRIIAVLHDIFKDSKYSMVDLYERGYSSNIMQALDHLTKRSFESYPDFIARCAENPLAKTVKIHDLLDNLNLKRIPTSPTEADLGRIEKYKIALKFLAEIKEGDINVDSK